MNLPNSFKIYLKTQSASPITIRNYLSDLNNFFSWLHQITGIDQRIAGKSVFGLFTKETLKEYQTHLIQKNIPIRTINRRFSTLRKFGQFAQVQGWLKDNAAEKIKNLPDIEEKQKSDSKQILGEFRSYLKQEKTSPMTIKNYLSDLRHFLSWLEIAT